MRTVPLCLAAMTAVLPIAATAETATAPDILAIAAIDTTYQQAVERNDWRGMDRILHPDFVLVLGDGRVYNRSQLLDSARNRDIAYDQQVEVPGTQTVRLFGNDTATVTALLRIKGTRTAGNVAFDRSLWFTDTYVRTADGWRYAFGQASLALPQEATGTMTSD